MGEFRKLLRDKMELLHLDDSFAGRYVNEGFSGGEKKRTEVLQMAMLEPKFGILDESDSGLDIDALRVVADGINKLATEDRGFLLVTHYQRILNYVKPDFVSIFLPRSHCKDRRL
jgi:Fe-S cluster assembly ATP-binding protein